jgi:hypothetical protein
MIAGVPQTPHNFSMISITFDFGAERLIQHGDFSQREGTFQLREPPAILHKVFFDFRPNSQWLDERLRQALPRGPGEGEAWRVRYFSPLCEVPFCGHATIALGAALALRHGDRTFELKLNRAEISVAGRRDGRIIAAALQSPPTRSAPIDPLLLADLLQLLTAAPSPSGLTLLL